jgi:uncharacterized protein YjbK
MNLPNTREMEIKLSLNRVEIERLVRLFANLGNQTIRDIYFDSSDFRLTKKDIWLRYRTSSKGSGFEMKVGAPSNLTSLGMTDYEEVRDINRIALTLGISTEEVNEYGLQVAGYPIFCSCITSRSKWKNGVFTVDVDDSSFAGYPNFSFPVVELEVEAENLEKAEELARSLFSERRIDFRLLPFGKICEFLRVNKPNHFQVLVDVGVIKLSPSEELKTLMEREELEPGEHGMII